MTVNFTSSRALGISWNSGFSGFLPFISCTVQAELTKDHSSQVIYLEDVSVPPLIHVIRGLTPFSQYRIRLACRTGIGISPWTGWVSAETREGGEAGAAAHSRMEPGLEGLCLDWGGNELNVVYLLHTAVTFNCGSLGRTHVSQSEGQGE
ncbi:hypothetical protein scyTo_0021278 [Scyliorhinus torazame]|uniref:Fibronectin type-III domain-containing protein n=1 Tax=Scyliorhinus torazame TaxID=75743 RepID=A0A401Q1J7_SCYTO|nr:hypothetical protein [Scyliorhinus torazame]